VANREKGNTNTPLELEPTLVQAQDVTATALPVTSKPKPSWNLQPQWRTELSGSMGGLSRQAAADATPQLPIPESFPLQPRFKKGPPAIGNAIADYRESMKPMVDHEPIRQPQSSTLANNSAPNANQGGPSFSPFGNPSPNAIAQSRTPALGKSPPVGTSATPIVDASGIRPQSGPATFDRSNLAATSSNGRGVSATTRFDYEPAWPDQTLATPSAAPRQAGSPFDFATPNLLTNARLPPSNPPRNSINPTPSFRPNVTPQPQPNPNGSNYIRQPMK
jgi:hypothetical protein